MSKINSILTIILFLVLLVTLFFVGISSFPKQKKEIGALLGDKLPEFKLSVMDSERVLSNYDFENTGNKFTLLNFYASWCKTCDIDHKGLMELENHEKLIIYGVMSKDNKKKSMKWLSQKGNPYDLITIDKFGRMKPILNLVGIPESFLIDSNGIIIAHFRGPIDAEKIKQIVENY